MVDNGKPYVTPDLVRIHVLLTAIKRKSGLAFGLGIVVLTLSLALLTFTLLFNSAPGDAYLIAFIGLLCAATGSASQLIIGRRTLAAYPHVEGTRKRIILLCFTPTCIAVVLWMGCYLIYADTSNNAAYWLIFVLYPILNISSSLYVFQTTALISDLSRRYGTAALMPLWHFQHQQVEQQIRYLEQFRTPPAASPPHAPIPQQPTFPTQ